jgi:hypothetical protein
MMYTDLEQPIYRLLLHLNTAMGEKDVIVTKVIHIPLYYLYIKYKNCVYFIHFL